MIANPEPTPTMMTKVKLLAKRAQSFIMWRVVRRYRSKIGFWRLHRAMRRLQRQAERSHRRRQRALR